MSLPKLCPTLNLLALAVLFCSLLCSEAWATDAVWIDVRSAEEYAAGHVPPAVNIPHDEIAERIAQLDLTLDQPILLYCRSGRRSGIALETLKQLGYSRVNNVGGLQDAEQRYQESGLQADP